MEKCSSLVKLFLSLQIRTVIYPLIIKGPHVGTAFALYRGMDILMDYMSCGNSALSPAADIGPHECHGIKEDSAHFDSFMQQEKMNTSDNQYSAEEDLSTYRLAEDIEESNRSTPADSDYPGDKIEDDNAGESGEQENGSGNEHSRRAFDSGADIFILTGGITPELNGSIQPLPADQGNAGLIHDQAGLSGLHDQPANDIKASDLTNLLRSGHSEEGRDNTTLDVNTDDTSIFTEAESPDPKIDAETDVSRKAGRLMEKAIHDGGSAKDNSSILKGEAAAEEGPVDVQRVPGDGAMSSRQAVDSEFRNGTTAYEEVSDEMLNGMDRKYTGEQAGSRETVDNSDHTDEAKSRLLSDSHDDLSHENRFFKNAFNNSKGRSDAGPEGNNGAQVSAGKITGEGVKQPESPFTGNPLKVSGFNELLDSVVYAARGNNRIGVTVEHEQFGKLQVNVSMDKGSVHVHIHTSDKIVREFVENNVQEIINSLSEDGISVGEFSIALKDNNGRDRFDDNHNSRSDSRSGEVNENKDKQGPSASGAINIFV